MSELTVLIVEDDPASSDILTELLEHDGMVVTAVTSGEAALELLAEHTYTLAIVDLALPGMDGWQVQAALRDLPGAAATIPVALTAYYTPLLAQEARTAGFAAAFAKPITPSFVKSVKRLL